MCVLLIYCCKKKKKKFPNHGSEYWKQLSWWFQFEFLTKLPSGFQRAVNYLKVSVSPHAGVSTARLQFLTTWQLDSPSMRGPRDQGEISNAIRDSVLEIILSYLQVLCWSQRPALSQRGRREHTNMSPRRQGPSLSHWRPATILYLTKA